MRQTTIGSPSSRGRRPVLAPRSLAEVISSRPFSVALTRTRPRSTFRPGRPCTVRCLTQSAPAAANNPQIKTACDFLRGVAAPRLVSDAQRELTLGVYVQCRAASFLVSPLACSARAVLGARATQDTKGAARLTNAAFQPRQRARKRLLPSEPGQLTARSEPSCRA